MGKTGAKARAMNTDEMFIAKIMALLHDPPWKHLAITGSLHGKNPVGAGRANRLARFACRAICGKNCGKKHEEQAAAFAAATLSCLSGTEAFNKILEMLNNSGRNRINLVHGIVKTADGMASSFDRIAAGYADAIYRSMYRNKLLKTAVKHGLFNIFDPDVVAAKPYVPKDAADKLEKAVPRFLQAVRETAGRYPDLDMRGLYHVFSFLYEPLWYRSLEDSDGGVPRWAWGPADTRVPHHSVFDHLYATASAVNLLANKVSRRVDFYGGVFVYVGFRGLKDWLGATRKLSDSWIASWLATAMAWYAVKEIVWCLGPDVLLIPGFRWNQFYLSLLWEKLGLGREGEREESGDKVAEVAREFYFWRGYPYYAWQPAFAVLVLPLAVQPARKDDECAGLFEALYGYNGDCVRACSAPGKGPRWGEDCRHCLECLAESVEGYLRHRLREAWSNVVEAVYDVLVGGGEQGKGYGQLAKEIARMLRELVAQEPPMEPLVKAFPIVYYQDMNINYFATDSGVYEGKHGGKGSPYEACVELLQNELKIDRNTAETICKTRSEVRSASNKKYSTKKYSIVIASKLLYAAGYLGLMTRVNEEKTSVARPGWARLSEKRFRRLACWYRTLYRDAANPPGVGGKWWENCSVCRRGVAVLRVPGRDLPGGDVSEEYRRFAERLGGCSEGQECWRVWRPVFAPGERLCPHCLVKRLAGLSEFYRHVGERLLGYKPPHEEVRFPSTGDVAALAAKLGLLRAARRFVEKLREGQEDSNVAKQFEQIALTVSTVAHRSRLVREAAETLRSLVATRAPSQADLEEARNAAKDLVRKRFWTPWLLYREVLQLQEALDSVFNNTRGGGEARTALVAGLAALLAANIEFYDAPVLLSDGSSLYQQLRQLSESAGALMEGEEAREVAEALRRPRLYYGLLNFDVNRGTYAALGLLLDKGGGGYRRAESYLAAMAESHCRLLLCGRASPPAGDMRDVLRSVRFFANYLFTLGKLQVRGGDNMLVAASKVGTVLVTPSYHYAISSAYAYTLLRSAIVAERLGGIPVYMGGDEGLVFLPAWVPWSLSWGGGYRREVARAAGFPEEVVAASPAAVYAVLLRRIYWASSAAQPGFHPVKPGGRGRTAYRIPAVVSNGLGIGLHYAHYRDHLYAATAAAEMLLEEAKSGEGGAARDAAALFFGRLAAPRPGEAVGGAVVLPNTEAGSRGVYELIRGAARYTALSLVIAGLVEKGLASSSLLRGLDRVAPGGPRGLQALLDSKAAGPAARRRLLEGVARVLAERYVAQRRLNGNVLAVDAARRALREAGMRLPGVLQAALIVYEASARSGRS